MRGIKKVLLIIAAVLSILMFVHDQVRGESEKERKQRLIEGAKKEGTMVLYGSISTTDGRILRSAFEKKYPFIKTKHYRAGSDTLMEKILIETRAGRHSADVYNMRSFTARILIEKGLFGKYRSPESKSYPKGFSDPNGYWTSFYMNPATMGYNTDLVPKDQAPKNWSDLLHPRWKGQMVLDREESEWFANMLKLMGREKGLDYMKKLAAQDITYRAGHTLMAQLVAAGEFKVGIVLYSYRVERMKSGGAPIDWVRAKPIVAYHYPVGVAAKAPHPNAAKLFVDFVLSKEGQEVLVKRGRVPVRKGVKPKPAYLVEGVDLVPSDTLLAKEFGKYFKEYRKVFKVP